MRDPTREELMLGRMLWDKEPTSVAALPVDWEEYIDYANFKLPEEYDLTKIPRGPEVWIDDVTMKPDNLYLALFESEPMSTTDVDEIDGATGYSRSWMSYEKYFLSRRVGTWLINKAIDQQIIAGTYAAARNLRKQGVPLELALDILA